MGEPNRLITPLINGPPNEGHVYTAGGGEVIITGKISKESGSWPRQPTNKKKNENPSGVKHLRLRNHIFRPIETRLTPAWLLTRLTPAWLAFLFEKTHVFRPQSAYPRPAWHPLDTRLRPFENELSKNFVWNLQILKTDAWKQYRFWYMLHANASVPRFEFPATVPSTHIEGRNPWL